MQLYPSTSDCSIQHRPRLGCVLDLDLVRDRGGRVGVVVMHLHLHLASRAGSCPRHSQSRARETVIGSDSGVYLGRTFRWCLKGNWKEEKKDWGPEADLSRETVVVMAVGRRKKGRRIALPAKKFPKLNDGHCTYRAVGSN